MKTHILKGKKNWSDFDIAASIIIKKPDYFIIKKIEGPDARCWQFKYGRHDFWLVYDDILGLSLKTESTELPLDELAFTLK